MASTSRGHSPLPPGEGGLREKLKREGSQLKQRAKAASSSRPSGEWRRGLREDDLGELHDPEYKPFRHATQNRPTSSRASSISSIEAAEDDLNPSRSYYGRSLQLPGLPNGVTTGVLPSSSSAKRQSYRPTNGLSSSYAATRPPSSYLVPDQETLYPGAIAGDSVYNPHSYTFKHRKYEQKPVYLEAPRPSRGGVSPAPARSSILGQELDGTSSTRSPSRPTIAKEPAAAASIAESEDNELMFESEYIPSLNQPSRHRQRTVPGTTRQQEDSFEAGCYKVKRAFQATKLDLRFAMVRLKRKTGMS